MDWYCVLAAAARTDADAEDASDRTLNVTTMQGENLFIIITSEPVFVRCTDHRHRPSRAAEADRVRSPHTRGHSPGTHLTGCPALRAPHNAPREWKKCGLRAARA